MGTITLPNTLTAGAVENINHVQSNFTTITSEVNGNLDDTNLKSTFSGYATYKHVLQRFDSLASAAVASSPYALSNQQTGALPFSGSITAGAVFYLDPADYTAGSLTTRYRVRASLMTNATAPAITFTVGLYPISAVAGGAGANTVTAGVVTAGSTVAFASQALSTRGQANSGDFTAPVAGYYALGVAASGSQAANSRVMIDALLEMRQT